MIAYKFLSSDRVGLFSGVTWPEPGTWLEADAEVERCASGIHALHAEGLLGWIDDELWTCELDGIVEDDGRELVAERGRLLERVAVPGTRPRPATSPARARREGATMWSRRFARRVTTTRRGSSPVSTPRAIVTTAPGVAARLPAEIAGLVLMAADTTALAEGRRLEAREPQLRSHLEAVADGGATHGAAAANVAFVVAHSTSGLHPEGYEAGFATERAWQLERLVEQLGLAVST